MKLKELINKQGDIVKKYEKEVEERLREIG
jgi:hypothetical protein